MQDNKSKCNPFLTDPTTPSHLRRARHHDYCRPARYMITLHKSESIPELAAIAGNLTIKMISHPEAPKAIPNSAGSAFNTAIDLWCRQYPQIQVDGIVIMPDHIHLCINVKQYLKIGLSHAIANLMGKTTIAYISQLDPLPDPLSLELNPIHFFSKGFNDSIAYNDAQYRTQLDYIADNPRRLLMKRRFPDLYRMRWLITAGDLRVMAIGNIHLLKHPHLQVVRFSRRFDSARLAENEKAYLRCIDNGGALISPFIHPYEKEIRDYAIEAGGNIIRICENGFSERFSPAKSEFDLMGSRRLLLIAPMEYNSRKQDMKYAYAQQLNHMAELLTTHPADLRISPI